MVAGYECFNFTVHCLPDRSKTVRSAGAWIQHGTRWYVNHWALSHMAISPEFQLALILQENSQPYHRSQRKRFHRLALAHALQTHAQCGQALQWVFSGTRDNVTGSSRTLAASQMHTERGSWWLIVGFHGRPRFWTVNEKYPRRSGFSPSYVGETGLHVFIHTIYFSLQPIPQHISINSN